MTDIEALERRVRELEDERALRELTAFYSFNADFSGRQDDYVDMYTDDAGIDRRAWGMPNFQGKEGLRQFIESPEATMFMGRSLHHAAPVVFYVDGDEAVGEGYSVLYVYGGAETPGSGPLQGDITVPHANVGRWKFRRVDGKWKIVKKDVEKLGSPAAGKLLRRTRAVSGS